MSLPLFRTALAALAAAALALPAAAQDWSGRGRLNGVVLDEADKPIAGATIRLRIESSPEQGPPDMQTDKKGKWSYLGLLGGPWTVKVVAEGYVPSEGIVKVNEFQPNPLVSLKLRRATAAEIAAVVDPKLAEAQGAIERADVFLRQRNAPAARAEYEKALPLLEGANRQIVQRKIALCWSAEGNDEAAVTTLEASLAEAPGDADTLRLLVDQLVAMGRNDEANTYIAQMAQGGGSLDPNTLLNMGINLLNDSKDEEALAKFEQVVSMRPDWADGYYFRGRALLVLGRLAESKADFQKVLDLDPNNQYAEDCREFLKSL
jgi:tetratricopeptide (TPR) repeat protein